MDEDPGAPVHTFVGEAGTAAALARAGLLHLHLRAIHWVVYALVFVMTGFIAYGVVERTSSVSEHALRSMVTGAPFALVLLTANALMLHRMMKRRLAHEVAPGAMIESEFAQEEFVVRGRAATRRIPYSAVKAVAVRGECVILTLHGLPVPWLLPSALIPDDALGLLQGGPSPPEADVTSFPARATPPGSPVERSPEAGRDAGRHVALDHRFVADGDTATRMARAHARGLPTRPGFWVLHLVEFVILTLILTGGLSGDRGLEMAPAVVLSAVLTGLLGGYTILVTGRATARNVSSVIVPGAVLESGFGDIGYVTRGPGGQRYVPYSSVQDVTRRGDFVLIREVDDPVLRIYPSMLFPDHALDRLSLGTSRRGGPPISEGNADIH